LSWQQPKDKRHSRKHCAGKAGSIASKSRRSKNNGMFSDAIKEDAHDISTLEQPLPVKTRKQMTAKFRELLTDESAQRPWTFEEECILIVWIHANGR
jgi:hypothetical protein